MGKIVKTTVTGAAITALLSLATPAIQRYEGYSSVPYRDQVGKLTVCFGETHAKMKRYTKVECQAMLNGTVEQVALDVVSRNPTLVGHPYQWAAATSLTYNIGIGKYRESTVAKEFSAGHWVSACNHFLDWKYAGGKINPGLLNRRTDEMTICLIQLPTA